MAKDEAPKVCAGLGRVLGVWMTSTHLPTGTQGDTFTRDLKDTSHSGRGNIQDSSASSHFQDRASNLTNPPSDVIMSDERGSSRPREPSDGHLDGGLQAGGHNEPDQEALGEPEDQMDYGQRHLCSPALTTQPILEVEVDGQYLPAGEDIHIADPEIGSSHGNNGE